MNLAAGTSLQNGKYLINHVLSQRGLGITFQGTQVETNRPVVVKTLKPDLPAQSLTIRQRFHEQIKRFAQCSHPALVHLVDSFEEFGVPFAVMDFTLGQSLEETVQCHGSLAEAIAVKYIEQVGSALANLHQHGVIHCDVRPKNIIRPAGSDIVVLVNLGLTDPSCLKMGERDLSPLAGSYAAFEQYHPDLPITPATDVYLLAGTLYFLLTGRTPIAAPNRKQEQLPAPRQWVPSIRPQTEAAILQGLELDSAKRPASVMEWLACLQTAHALPHPANLSQPEVAPKKDGNTGATVANHAREQSVAQGNIQPQSASAARSVAQSSVMRQASPNASGKTYSSSPTVATSIPSHKSTILNPHHSSMTTLASKRFSNLLITVSAIAAAMGIGGGLALRVATTATGSGSSFFHSEQAFPKLDGWPGEVSPVDPPNVYAAPAADATQPVKPRVMPTSQIYDELPKVAPSPSPTATEPASSQTDVTDLVPAPAQEDSEPTRSPESDPPLPTAPAPAPITSEPAPVNAPAVPAPALAPEPPPPPASTAPPAAPSN